MTVLMIALGAAVGAPARYLTDRGVQRRYGSLLPWGTLLVNVVACAVLGFLGGAGSHIGPVLRALLGTGFCGALSTYSTFSFEAVRLAETGRHLHAGAYVGTSLVLGIGVAGAGWTIGSAVF